MEPLFKCELRSPRVCGYSISLGDPSNSYDCNGTAAQKWTINASTTKVVLAGTEFCLDAGSSE